MKRNIVVFFRLSLIAACGMVLVPEPVAAGPHGKGKPGKHADKGNQVHKSSGDRAAHRDYATSGITAIVARGLVAELGLDRTGYKPLPPGIQKNLARGKPLPPGIAKQVAPSPLIARLPVHAGHEWRVAGRDLVLVAVATGIIADVLFDVF